MENICVCVRVRPKQTEEDMLSTNWKLDERNIINLKTKEVFTYGNSFYLILFFIIIKIEYFSLIYKILTYLTWL